MKYLIDLLSNFKEEKGIVNTIVKQCSSCQFYKPRKGTKRNIGVCTNSEWIQPMGYRPVDWVDVCDEWQEADGGTFLQL